MFILEGLYAILTKGNDCEELDKGKGFGLLGMVNCGKVTRNYMGETR